ncbi:MAG: serine protease [Desulfobulbaceae bacterium]|jgi:S1-C subfamily serine protease|nr:serine protease [Desulfobulbaceae bacterium]
MRFSLAIAIIAALLIPRVAFTDGVVVSVPTPGGGQYTPPPAGKWVPYFSDQPFTPDRQQEQRRPAPVIISGTGFFVSDNGLFATNYHVAGECSRVVIINTGNGREIPARLVQADGVNDLAVLRADVPRSTPIPLAFGFNLKPGEDVLTLGYPDPERMGLQQKATFGLVNAATGIQDDPRLCQVDLPIQPGNSGGPLLSLKGEVVGIVTARLKGDVQNVNYAVKVDYLRQLLEKRGVASQSGSDNKMSRPEVVEAFKNSVVLVLCWQ